MEVMASVIPSYHTIYFASWPVPMVSVIRRGLVLTMATSSSSRSLMVTARSQTLRLGSRPLMMGILNVTPDSFSDGGAYVTVEQALHHARQMQEEGADIIDIGAESSRPGAQPIDESEELRRLIPVLEAVMPRFRFHFD